ncbi:MAG: ABC transporter permease subunit [Lachnospiraceae bacterium]
MNIFSQFYQFIIVEGAYEPIFTGLITTLIITVASLFFGTILATILTYLVRSRWVIIRGFIEWFNIFVRGTPILMLLMLLYYIVFARSDIEAIVVAIIAFSINSSAHICQIMLSALLAVDDGQIKAARTLGFSKSGAFFNVTLPQAIVFARPVYQNATITILHWTSVVGYITITDLTRVINNIGSRTAKPFFALALGIAIYLILGAVINLIFKLTEKESSL